MKVNKETLRKIAHLSRLELQEKDEAPMINSLNEILEWVDQLNEVDTSEVEPLTNMSFEVNVYREDAEKSTISHEEALKNAPHRDQDYFKVPKVIDQDS
jgi:aspartyl-tRNA(Asn)/glutamyl-tRNA(Gln) amidotransferase subunit C